MTPKFEVGDIVYCNSIELGGTIFGFGDHQVIYLKNLFGRDTNWACNKEGLYPFEAVGFELHTEYAARKQFDNELEELLK